MDQDRPETIDNTPTPADNLHQRLSLAAENGTPSERALAHYLASNLSSLPFETAATIAAKVGVSEASVGRFCRSIEGAGVAPAPCRAPPPPPALAKNTAGSSLGR